MKSKVYKLSYYHMYNMKTKTNKTKTNKKKLLSSEEYKDLVLKMREDYIEVKEKAMSLGYNDSAVLFEDYMENYIKLNSKL